LDAWWSPATEAAVDMPQDEKTIEKPKRNRRRHKQVYGGYAIGLVAQKGPPL
jgi:hypothetical protein